MKKLFFFLAVTGLLYGESVLMYQDAKDLAKSTNNYFKNNFDSAISKPLTSDASFSTVSGNKTFKANLTCNEQVKSFLSISYTGISDIALNVSLDKNLDGTKESSYSFSGVSGLGTNGIIICSANTFNTCKYYKWGINSNGDLITILTDRINFKNGYCINSSCGSLSRYNKRELLEDIGGAISSIYQTYSSNYLITKTSNDGTNIEFFGQNFNECSNLQGRNNLPSYSETNDAQLDPTQAISNDTHSSYYVLRTSLENNTSSLTSDEKTTITRVNQSIQDTASFDKSSKTFSYTAEQKDENGTWITSNNGGTVQVDIGDNSIKYCEVQYLIDNTQIHSDNTEHTTQSNEIETYKSDVRQCTGEGYTVCPFDTSKGETIKHDCGNINNFAEVTSKISTLQQMSNDFTCTQE